MSKPLLTVQSPAFEEFLSEFMRKSGRRIGRQNILPNRDQFLPERPRKDTHEVPGNTNGKMGQQVYIDQILEPIVKPWIQVHQDFVLEEDGDLGHGPGKSNIEKLG